MKIENNTPCLLDFIEDDKKIGHITFSNLFGVVNIEYFNIYGIGFDNAIYDEALRHFENHIFNSKKKNRKIIVSSYNPVETSFWRRNYYRKNCMGLEKSKVA